MCGISRVWSVHTSEKNIAQAYRFFSFSLYACIYGFIYTEFDTFVTRSSQKGMLSARSFLSLLQIVNRTHQSRQRLHLCVGCPIGVQHLTLLMMIKLSSSVFIIIQGSPGQHSNGIYLTDHNLSTVMLTSALHC